MKLELKKSLIITFIILVISALIFCYVCIGRILNDRIENNNYSCRVYRDKIELKYQNSKSLIIDEVDKYIKNVAPTSSLNAITLFNLCEEYDVDVKFALAQGHIESHFGTKGMAKKTNSVFNVFAFDGESFHKISKKGKYSHPDYSIEPYLNLIRSNYLIDGKSEYDLMEKFINQDGKRYASDPLYESKLRSKFEYISENTNLDELLSNYNMYKIILMN
jgi:flagellum-specific peptidoglycan hydrolase FlgJ